MKFTIKNIEDIKEVFKGINTPIFYAANNVDKGVGLEKLIYNYHIICIDYEDEVEYLKARGVDVFCLERESGEANMIFRNSGLLLKQKNAVDYIKNYQDGKINILVFKPSLSVEKICRDNGWNLLNNGFSSSRTFEDKLEFYKIARKLNLLIPQTREIKAGAVEYKDLKNEFGDFVIQRGSGFAGRTTYFINSEGDYAAVKKRYPSEIVKASQFIRGVPITINACATRFGTVVGGICHQITGLPLCTNNFGTTCGNDWSALRGNLKFIRDSVAGIVRTVGGHMFASGYKGIFGVDLIFEPVTGKIYLIECNPRFVASIPMATKLEIMAGRLPLLALHLLEFLDVDYEMAEDAAQVSGYDLSGAQAVARNIEKTKCAVKGKFRSGVYRLEKNQLLFLRPGYSPEDISESGEFVVLTVSHDRVVSPEAECARIESKGPLLDGEGKLAGWAETALKSIYRDLQLAKIY